MIEWRDVVGYEGLYQVSSDGRIRSLDRIVPHSRYGQQFVAGRMLSPQPSGRHEYLHVRLSKEGKTRTLVLHRLVALAFLGTCPHGKQVRHGNKGGSDNSVGNLSYGSKSDNELDKRRDGTSGGVRVIRSDGVEFDSLSIAAEETGCHRNSICDACKGRQKTAGGFSWEYA